MVFSLPLAEVLKGFLQAESAPLVPPEHSQQSEGCWHLRLMAASQESPQQPREPCFGPQDLCLQEAGMLG